MSRCRTSCLVTASVLALGLAGPAVAAGVTGTTAADVLDGGRGDDVLVAGSGDAWLTDGAGYDRVWNGGEPDPRDRFHDCEEFSDHP